MGAAAPPEAGVCHRKLQADWFIHHANVCAAPWRRRRCKRSARSIDVVTTPLISPSSISCRRMTTSGAIKTSETPSRHTSRRRNGIARRSSVGRRRSTSWIWSPPAVTKPSFLAVVSALCRFCSDTIRSAVSHTANAKVFADRKPRFSAEERQRGWHVQYAGLEPGHAFVRAAERSHGLRRGGGSNRFELVTPRLTNVGGHAGRDSDKSVPRWHGTERLLSRNCQP